jgi:hypothetical protein
MSEQPPVVEPGVKPAAVCDDWFRHLRAILEHAPLDRRAARPERRPLTASRALRGQAKRRTKLHCDGWMPLMRRKIIGGLVAIALSTPVGIMATTVTAQAAGKYYSSCSALSNNFAHGVAKSRTAARKQVRQGYAMPAYGQRARSVYWTNYKRLDRDRDGTACER